MITPYLQSSPSALSPEQVNPGESEGVFCFDGRSISQLPVEVLPGVTRYLSMREVLVLGQVCSDLRSNLERCGVITDIWNYLSLPKNRKRSIQRLVTGNRLLIDHLRKNPVCYSRSFPIQHSPAIYTKYASHFRERMVSGASVTLEPVGCIDGAIDLSLFKLNYQHNCLIRNGCADVQLQVWTNQKDGSWEREYVIDQRASYVDSRRHGTDILFLNEEVDGKSLMSVVKRSELGKWNVVQKQYLNEFSSLWRNDNVQQIQLAENQRLMVCELVVYGLSNCLMLIFGEGDSRWRKEGSIEICRADNQFRFSQGCGHIAVISWEVISFISRRDDGSWKKTGEIKLYKFEKENCEFSVDDHHFVVWGRQYQSVGKPATLFINPLVIVASLDDRGHWSEVQRINRVRDETLLEFYLSIRFGPDGKQLFVCINDELKILSLHEGKWVSSTHLLEPWSGSECIIRTTMNPSLFMVTAGRNAWIYAMDASGGWGRQHEFSIYPKFFPKISSDGDTVICNHYETGLVDIWSRRHSDQWIKQEIVIAASRGKFSPDGSLVALVRANYLIVLGLTEKCQWQEKGRQTFGGRVTDFSFSPCGRYIRVDCLREEGVITFWQIVPQE